MPDRPESSDTTLLSSLPTQIHPGPPCTQQDLHHSERPRHANESVHHIPPNDPFNKSAHHPTTIISEAAAILHAFVTPLPPSMPRILLEPKSRSLVKVVTLTDIPTTPPIISRSGSVGVTSSFNDMTPNVTPAVSRRNSRTAKDKNSSLSIEYPTTHRSDSPSIKDFGAIHSKAGSAYASAPLAPNRVSHFKTMHTHLECDSFSAPSISVQTNHHDMTQPKITSGRKGPSAPCIQTLSNSYPSQFVPPIVSANPLSPHIFTENVRVYEIGKEKGHPSRNQLLQKINNSLKFLRIRGSGNKLIDSTSPVAYSAPVINSTNAKVDHANIFKFISTPTVKKSEFKHVQSKVNNTLKCETMTTPPEISTGNLQDQIITPVSEMSKIQPCQDRYYDPDEEKEDRNEMPMDNLPREFVPLKEAQAVTSSTSIGSKNSRKMIRMVPSPDIVAHLDPLASARNLLRGMNEGSFQVRNNLEIPNTHQGGSGGGDDGGAGADYLQYLLTRKFSSTNFITRFESHEVIQGLQPKPIAKFIGPFIMGKVIGKGSFGKVKDAMCSETLQTVAVKILSHQRLKKVQFGIESVTHEIHTLRKLRGHPNVVRLLEVYAKVEDPGGNVDVLPWTHELDSIMQYKILKRFMIFEFCHGNLQSLLDSSPSKRIPLHQTQDYMIQLTEGLIYLHARHIVHRDIKPANLLLTLDGVLKISDFGVAEVLSPYDGNDYCQNFAGTNQFMSPEVVAGESLPSGEKIDVWAAGVTLHNMVFGAFPSFVPKNADMSGDDLPEYSKLILPNDTQQDLANLLPGLLAYSPETRYTLLQVRAHPFLCIESCELAVGKYVPLPTLTPDAAIAHAAVTHARGKGSLARPVSPRTLCRRPKLPAIMTKSPPDPDLNLPYSLFRFLDPLFPELASLTPFPKSMWFKSTDQAQQEFRKSGAGISRRFSLNGSARSNKSNAFRFRFRRT